MSSPIKRSPVLGYNHNLRYLERTWHVQSEDSGVDNPAINTHVFHEGAILASVKIKYDVAMPEAAVQKLMQAQHKAMMRDLKAGVFDEKIERFYPGSMGRVPAQPTEKTIPAEELAAKTIAMPIVTIPEAIAAPIVATPVVTDTVVVTETVQTPIVASTEPVPVSAVAEFDGAPTTKPSIVPAAVRAAPPPKTPLTQTQKLPAILPPTGDKPHSRVAPPAARPPQTPPPNAPAPPALSRPGSVTKPMGPPPLRAPENRPKVDTQKSATTAPKMPPARAGATPPPQPKIALAPGAVTLKSAVSPVQRRAPKLVPSPPRVVVTSRRGATLPSLDDLQRGPARAPISGARTTKTLGIFGEDPSKEKSLDEAILAYLAEDAPDK